jgi:hypothetical protein
VTAVARKRLDAMFTVRCLFCISLVKTNRFVPTALRGTHKSIARPACREKDLTITRMILTDSHAVPSIRRLRDHILSYHASRFHAHEVCVNHGLSDYIASCGASKLVTLLLSRTSYPRAFVARQFPKRHRAGESHCNQGHAPVAVFLVG